jgi:hypothetical protein
LFSAVVFQGFLENLQVNAAERYHGMMKSISRLSNQTALSSLHCCPTM